MKRTITAALMLGLSSTAGAQLNNEMEGSDTMKDLIIEGFLGELGIPIAELNYIGTGSGNGETELESNFQEIAPMSRFLDEAACGNQQADDARAAGDAAGCYAMCGDAVAVASDNFEDTTCDVLRSSGTMDVTDVNGGGIDCPNCLDADTYEFQSWRDVLRIIYAGQHAHVNTTNCGTEPTRSLITDKNCGSDVRATLVNTWSNMFQGGCADGECAQLKHAFRRDDASGTTDTFLTLLALPAIASTPFCNGPDSGPVPPAVTAASTWNDVFNRFNAADKDPIRRTCDNREQICRFVADAGEPASYVGTLGLVLPIKSPAGNDPYFTLTGPGLTADPDGGRISCANNPLLAGVHAARAMAPASVDPPNCPNGATRVANQCRFPKQDGTGAVLNQFDCLAAPGSRPGFPPAATPFDGRKYNLLPRNNNGTRYNTEAQITNMQRSPFYRLHATRVIANTGVGATSAVTPNGDFAATNDGCRENDATDQIACFSLASPCSIGYIGATALQYPRPDVKGLGMREVTVPNAGTKDADTDSFPNASDSLASCAGGESYPMARTLNVCTLNTNLTANTGTQNTIPGFIDAQVELRDDGVLDPALVEAACIDQGFFNLLAATSEFTDCCDVYPTSALLQNCAP